METRFFAERGWRLPWQDRLKTVSAREASERVERGDAVWAQPADAEVPLPVASREQLRVASGSEAPADLSELARSGIAFQARVAGARACVGVYGAYLALTPESGVDQLALLDPRSQLPMEVPREEFGKVNAYYARENKLETEGYTFWNSQGQRVASYLGTHLGREEPWFELGGEEAKLRAMDALRAEVSLETAVRALPEYLAGGALVGCSERPEERVALAEMALKSRPELQEMAARLTPEGRVALVEACPDGKLRAFVPPSAQDALAQPLPDWQRSFVDSLRPLPARTQKLALQELSAQSPDELGARMAGVSRAVRDQGDWKGAAALGVAALKALHGIEAPALINPGSTVALCESYLEHRDPAKASEAVRGMGYEKSWNDAVTVGRTFVSRLGPAGGAALEIQNMAAPGSFVRLYEGVLKGQSPADILVEIRGSGYNSAWSDARVAGKVFVEATDTPTCRAARQLGDVHNPGTAVHTYEAALRSDAATLEDVGALGVTLSKTIRALEGYGNAWWDAAAIGKAFCAELAPNSRACRAALGVEDVFNPGSIVAVYDGVLSSPRSEVGALGRQLSQTVRDKNYASNSWQDAVKVGRAFVAEVGDASALAVEGLFNPGSFVMTYEAALENAGQDTARVGAAAVSAVMSRPYTNITQDGLKVAESYARALPPDGVGKLLTDVSTGFPDAARLVFLREALDEPGAATPQKCAEVVLTALANVQQVDADSVARAALQALKPAVSDPAMQGYLQKGIDSRQNGEPVRILDMLAHFEYFKPEQASVVEREDFVQILGSRVKVRKPPPTVGDPTGGAGQ